jgi:hypothetical protein
MRNRSVQLICNAEKDLSDLAWAVVKSESMSMSTYLRALVIADLKARGLLTQEMIEALL